MGYDPSRPFKARTSDKLIIALGLAVTAALVAWAFLGWSWGAVPGTDFRWHQFQLGHWSRYFYPAVWRSWRAVPGTAQQLRV